MSPYYSPDSVLSEGLENIDNVVKMRLLVLICGFRYHYNVADVRLAQHIEKGNEDGLFISSVASSPQKKIFMR